MRVNDVVLRTITSKGVLVYEYAAAVIEADLSTCADPMSLLNGLVWSAPWDEEGERDWSRVTIRLREEQISDIEERLAGYPHTETRITLSEAQKAAIAEAQPKRPSDWEKLRPVILPANADEVDLVTAQSIDTAIHPTAPIGEQIGILRAQIGDILNHIGLAPTDDFDRLNTIAAEKIQEAQAKKEAL